VTSSHHQAVRRIGRRLRATGTSPDGVVEMIERTDRRFAIGMQWHPEITRRSGDRVAQALVRAAGQVRRAQEQA
jgi:putative glutamine amidotransferase